MQRFTIAKHVDPILSISALLIAMLGVASMSSLDASTLMTRQLIWLGVATGVYIGASLFDYRFLRRRGVVLSAYTVAIVMLITIFLIGSAFQGAQSWLDLGAFAVQPAEFAKLAVVLILAKYFSRRHIEIASFKHILVSGLYAFVIFALILVQPDFGSAVIVAFVWLGMVLASGISKRHLILLALLGAAVIFGAWHGMFQEYQKERILTFIHPLADIQGAGYNAYQSMVAVGSGQVLGKGLGYGTQSKLKFLPEYETDFIFAAFAEEWGFIGVLLLFTLFAVVVWRLLYFAMHGASNFETLFTVGVVALLVSHFFVNVGMNIGLLPVTGVTLPFMSYGGSHLVVEALALGIVTAMHRYSRVTHPDELDREFLGV